MQSVVQLENCYSDPCTFGEEFRFAKIKIIYSGESDTLVFAANTIVKGTNMTERNTENISKKELSRRGFFILLSGTLSGFIAFVLGIPLIASILGTVNKVKNKIFSRLTPINTVPILNPVNLNFVTAKTDAFIKSVEPQDAWVIKRSNFDITVFSPICPHLGCRYAWNSKQKLFICPCHNSVFDINGKVISGPAPRGLDTLPKKIQHNELYVLWERFKVGIPQKIVMED